jgi:hypothetical protein
MVQLNLAGAGHPRLWEIADMVKVLEDSEQSVS